MRYRTTLGSAALCCLAMSILTVHAAEDALRPLRYEAEDCTGPPGAWVENRHVPGKWNLWTNDAAGHRVWSGGVVLQALPVREDRSSPEDGAQPLHTRITGIPNGRYDVEVKAARTVGVSLDGDGKLDAVIKFPGKQIHRGNP